MFPQTLDYVKTAKNAIDMFPQTSMANDINSILSSHVETIVLMSRKDK
jgi:hypothetical protein